MKHLTVRDYVQVALVAALYVVLTITPPLNAISYGAYQFRVSEMLNFMAFYHPKYILSVTLGCMIANFYSFGLIDVFVGGGCKEKGKVEKGLVKDTIDDGFMLIFLK